MAIKVEFGKCAQCGDNNPKQLQMCRKCGAPLPWAKQTKPKYSKAPAPSRAVAKPAFQFDWGTFGVGAISFAMPLIGFFLYRSYSNNGDNKADACLIGSILGILAVIVRVGMRYVS